MLKLVEQAHCYLLSAVKTELDKRGIHEVNNVQALLLFNCGNQVLRICDLRARSLYVGSNVTYNLKKLVEAGYIHRERSMTDGRTVFIRLTRKGQDVHDLLCDLFDRHTEYLGKVAEVTMHDFNELNSGLKKLCSFWDDQVRFQL